MIAPEPLRIAGFTVSAGVHPGGSTLPRHSHDGATLCLARRGAFREFWPGASLTCYPSTLKVTPAGQEHWNRFDLGDSRGMMIEVEGWRAAALTPWSAVLDERVHVDGGAAVAVAHRIHDEFARRDAAAPLAIEGLVLELIALLSRREERAAPAIAPWLRRAREAIHADPAGAHSLAELARLVDVHPVTLARGFRRAYGESVGGYVRRLRVERAAAQLRTTTAPLSEIALAAGFADQAHFSNVFRRLMGMSPRQYREAARG